jgi:phosphocarrier protein FPr
MRFFQHLFYKPYDATLHVTSKNGFHLRPIAQFVSLAKQYPCSITASGKGQEEVDAKGVNRLLSLSLEQGDSFTLTCRGKRAEEALNALKALFATLMQNDRETTVQEKSSHHYEGHTVEGEIIYGGVAMAPLYRYREIKSRQASGLTFKEAVTAGMDELTALGKAENTKAEIYLAQRALLDSLQAEVSTLEALEALVQEQCAELSGTPLEAKIGDYHDILQRVAAKLGSKTEMLLPEGAFILAAEDLLPSQIEALSQSDIEGVLLEKSSPASHTAILLREAGIPSLIVKTALPGEGERVILDACSGVVVDAPTSKDFHEAEKQLQAQKKETEAAWKKRFEAAETKEGKKIRVLANIMHTDTLEQAKEEGAEGIGLLRTEFLFKEQKPTLEMQVDAYEKVFSVFDDVTVRTLDVGGDKALPYIDLPRETNPFLGIRGIRLFQTHPELMEEQLHAIFLAAEGKAARIKIMFPMVSSVEEFIHAKTFAEQTAEKHGIDISALLFGIMVEVPSVLFAMDAFNKVVDFYSIGTNDLTQYLFAIERTHPLLKPDPLAPPLFAALRHIVARAEKPVSLCGELAADRKALPKLLELGIGTLSVSAKNVARTKEEIRNV